MKNNNSIFKNKKFIWLLIAILIISFVMPAYAGTYDEFDYASADIIIQPFVDAMALLIQNCPYDLYQTTELDFIIPAYSLLIYTCQSNYALFMKDSKGTVYTFCFNPITIAHYIDIYACMSLFIAIYPESRIYYIGNDDGIVTTNKSMPGFKYNDVTTILSLLHLDFLSNINALKS